ncbi:MAG: hypothetical protein Q9217_001249 [Psora testacea]
MATACANCLPKRAYGSGLEAARITYKSRPGAAELLCSRAYLHKRYNPVLPRPILQRRCFAAIGVPRLQTHEVPQKSTDPRRILETELARAAEVIQAPTVPSEAAIHDALQTCKRLAQSLNEPSEPSRESRRPDKTPTSNLLSLEEHAAKSSPPKERTRTDLREGIKNKIANTAYRIVTDPKIFVSPNSLSLYVITQAMLRRPQSFPRVFDLYASKPIPRAGSSPVIYTNPNPDSPKAAIPLAIAKTAFDAALETKDLPLCLSIIQTTVATSAFKRAKFIRKALLPATALALSPAAAYALGKAYADLAAERLDPRVATLLSTAAIMTYFSMTALTGYLAITTSGYQMDRVTWLEGTPLYERWFREEERAFTDRVAQAWGFQNYLRRGEEEGEEWGNLREWIVERNMILDKPELMEGME